MSTEHIKIHVMNNPKIKAELQMTKTLTSELWKQIHFDTGVNRDAIVSLLGDEEGNMYVIEGHKTPDEIFDLLERDDLPEGLRERLLKSIRDPGSKDTYQGKHR